MNASEREFNRIAGLFSNPSEVFVIHWSRQNLNDNAGGRGTPRIIAIIVRSLDHSFTKIFAIHLEAEKSSILWEEIENYYDQLEEQILKSFNSFVKEYYSYKWLYWDSDDMHLSFEAIKHRYCVLVDENAIDFIEVPITNRINLNSCLKIIYRPDYEEDPQFENLVKSNNNGQLRNNFLSVNAEAKAFRDLHFPTILASVNVKVDSIITIVNKTVQKKLFVSKSGIVYKIRNFFLHPYMVAIAWIATIVSLLFPLIQALFFSK